MAAFIVHPFPGFINTAQCLIIFLAEKGHENQN